MMIILLSIIIVLLIARFMLQVQQGKGAVSRHYCAPSEVELVVKVVKADAPFDMKRILERMASEGYELVSTHQPDLEDLYLFFTRKKIKTYYE